MSCLLFIIFRVTIVYHHHYEYSFDSHLKRRTLSPKLPGAEVFSISGMCNKSWPSCAAPSVCRPPGLSSPWCEAPMERGMGS